MRCLLITPEADRLAELAAALTALPQVELVWVHSGARALEVLAAAPADLMIVDEDLGDMNGLSLARRALRVNAAIHCAAVSSLGAEAFHEASEGLGLLAQLPPYPGQQHASALIRTIGEILALEKTASC
jgi:DNA-binding response OmpR family regulator